MTTFLRALGLALLALSLASGAFAVIREHRHAREFMEAREDPGGHVRTLPILFDQDGGS